jgi:hypothetical protein
LRNAHGYGVIIDPVLGMQESDQLSCIHCGQVDMLKSSLTGALEVMIFRSDGTHYMKEAGFCRNCMKHICPRCVGKPCSNRFKRMEEEEARARKFICS